MNDYIYCDVCGAQRQIGHWCESCIKDWEKFKYESFEEWVKKGQGIISTSDMVFAARIFEAARKLSDE